MMMDEEENMLQPMDGAAPPMDGAAPPMDGGLPMQMGEPPLDVDPAAEYVGDLPQKTPSMRAINKLRKYLPDAEGRYPNIADGKLLDDDMLQKIGAQARRDYDIDLASRSEWETRLDMALEIAMQTIKAKSYPFDGAANVKYPLITTAAIQFAARAYPAIIPNRNVVRCQVIGDDRDGKKKARGSRVSVHMSYQLTDEMEEWEEETDRLLIMLPITGVGFRKTYYDHSLRRNASCLVSPKDFVINYFAKSIDSAPRKSHRFDLYQNEIIERTLMGVFRDVELGLPPGSDDEQAPHEFIEQHLLFDLDEDGYAEPYIVTLHAETSQVVRMVSNYEETAIEVTDDGKVARIKGTEYFTKYSFIPAPDGSFYDVGFGTLIGPLNEAINTSINQMLDAGHLQNTGGGFIGSGMRLRAGSMRFSPGEYKQVSTPGSTVRDSIVQLQFGGPSPVLFQLLGLLIESARDVTAVKDIMVGETPGKNASPTTTLAVIEQGMKVFSAIYKRIHRSLKKELAKLYHLNSLYLADEAYYTVLDSQAAIARADYEEGSLDIVPVSDPTIVTDMQKMGKAEFLSKFIGNPAMDSVAILKRMFDAASIENAEELFAKEAPPPPPEVAMKQEELEIKKEELRIKGQEAEANLGKMKQEDQIKVEELRIKGKEAEAKIDALQADLAAQASKAQTDAQKTASDAAETNAKIEKMNAETAKILAEITALNSEVSTGGDGE
jgi:chaperonin GroES